MMLVRDTAPYSCSMADKGGKRYSMGEAPEAVVVDEDRHN